MSLKEINCPLCDARPLLADRIYRDPRKDPKTQNAWLVECVECKHVYVSPMTPEDYTKLDPKIFAPYDCVPGAENRFDFWYNDVIAEWGRLPGRMLEVGPGMGRFSARAKKAGWDVLAVEPSPCAKHVRELGVECLEQDFLQAPTVFQSFDVVVGIETLEHMEAPKMALFKMFAALKTPGLLYLTVPNFSCRKIRDDRDRAKWHEWPAMEPYGHLQYFKPGVLVQLLHEIGFDSVTSVTHNGNDDNQLRVMAWRRR